MSTRHDPARRAEASADPRIRSHQRLDLSTCRAGIPTWGEWTPVQGPHLKALRSRHARSRTGVTGISYGTTRHRRKDGSTRLRRYFVVQLGRSSRKFCTDTLGRNEAWRRAVKCRAEHEAAIDQINAAIRHSRKTTTQTTHDHA